MDWKQNTAVVIPCLNEAAHIATVVANAQEYVPAVIVVDDGSADATSAEAQRAGAEVLRCAVNGGKGSALRLGWRRARKLGYSWTITMDGDGQHSAQDIPNLFACAANTGASLIVGNRMRNPAAMPWLRRQTNRWMSHRISRLTGQVLPDSQCGFRLVHLETLLGLSLAANRFEIESEMLTAIIAAGHKVEFVPVQVIYKNGVSRIHPLADTWRWLRWESVLRKTLVV